MQTAPVAAPHASRRAALTSIIAMAAGTVVPRRALGAKGPDAGLFALARRAQAMALQAVIAEKAVDALEESLTVPPVAHALRARHGDAPLVGEPPDGFAEMVGEPLGEGHIAFARLMLGVLRRNIEAGVTVGADAAAALARAVEIDLAASRRVQEIAEARSGAGIPAAALRAKALSEALRAVYREIALTPAYTTDGVLAKLRAVAPCFCRPVSGELPPLCGADDVVSAAAGDLAAISG